MQCSTFFTTIIISHTYSLSSLCILYAHMSMKKLRSKYRQPYLESGLESDAESDVESGLETSLNDRRESVVYPVYLVGLCNTTLSPVSCNT